MTSPEERLDANRDHWNELTPINQASDFYDLDGFKAGKSSLSSIEVGELGDVSGRSLLHLMCHFGLDTLSWARLGARVTGVDFSDRAVDLAKSIAGDVGVDASFVRSDVYDLPRVFQPDEKFDIVFTSYGVLAWLPDLERWAQVVARYLKPGGTFYMVEFHPFADVFDDREGVAELKVHYPYFHDPKPIRFEPGVSYADDSAPVTTPTYEWHHGVGDVLDALISAGLRIEFFHEFPFCVYRKLPFMELGDDGWWRLKGQDGSIPLIFPSRPRRRPTINID